VVAANAAARAFFGIPAATAALSLVEATREARLAEFAAERAGRTAEVTLTHSRRRVRLSLVAGPGADERILYCEDLTQLRRLETMRQEFVANLTHELKTPLTSLRLAAETLLSDPPADSRRRFAQRVMDEASHLTGIIDNLRELAELDSGDVQLRLSRFELRPLVEEVAARGRQARPLRLDIPEGTAGVADRTKVAQVLANLLDNAFKFSPAGTVVEVSAAEGGVELTVRVRDHGPGLPPEHWQRVFERFYKADTARARGASGGGLGLAIAKHLVVAHGGRIWTEAALDGGQIFAFTLPRRLAANEP
jgi:two-component system phosphate regulon sensor histidine kinase PhoR